MSRIAYVNGAYAPADAPNVRLEDRGFQFSDGIYEVLLVRDGRLWDGEGHFARWGRSLAALNIRPPVADGPLRAIVRRVLRLNRLKDALVYLQATRGVARRDHAFTGAEGRPSLVVMARPFDFDGADAKAEKGVAVVSAPDIRWRRVDIKTVSLLPNCLAKDAARRAGASEAWLIRDGVVTEGGSSNAWILNGAGVLVTHPLGHDILGGITRETVMELAREMGVEIEERPFTLEEAKAANEAFITSATNLVTPVIRIDDAPVGDGAPGPIARDLRAAYAAFCAETARPA